MNKKKTLGQVLKSQRKFLGLTQRELALKLDVKGSHARSRVALATVAAMMAHPMDSEYRTMPALATHHMKITFHGRAAHASLGAVGRRQRAHGGLPAFP